MANETKEYIDEELIRARAGLAFNYHKLRNAFLILNLVAPDSILVDAAFEIDYRMKIVNRYLTSQKGHNILEVPEVVIDNMEGAGLLPVLEPVYTTYSA